MPLNCQRKALQIKNQFLQICFFSCFLCSPFSFLHIYSPKNSGFCTAQLFQLLFLSFNPYSGFFRLFWDSAKCFFTVPSLFCGILPGLFLPSKNYPTRKDSENDFDRKAFIALLILVCFFIFLQLFSVSHFSEWNIYYERQTSLFMADSLSIYDP